MNNKTWSSFLGFALTLLLVACGGGDGGSSSGGSASTASVSVPLQTAQANLVNNGLTVNFAISGTVGGTAVTGSGTQTDAPAVAAMLNGVSVLKTTETLSGTLMVNGTSTPLSSTRTIFRNPATFAEVSEDLGNGVTLVFPDFTYPVSVKAGDAASLVTATAFTNGAKAGTLVRSYSVAADTSTTLLVTFLDSSFDNNNVKLEDDQTTFRVDTSGNIQFVSETATFTINGQQGLLKFQ